MKAVLRFDVDALRSRAGDRAFTRGESYYRSEQVRIMLNESARVVAQVAGTEDYRTELTGRGKSIGGNCSCRAFAEYGFCKHMVAVGLAANAAGEDASVGALSQVRDHLKSKSVDYLVDVILDVAERDTGLFRKLELRAATAQLDDPGLEARLRKAIDAAIDTDDDVDYASASSWAEGVEEALEAIEELQPGRSGIALKLARHAIDRIERALDGIDDSDGHGSQLLTHADEIHLAAATEHRPEPVEFARDLFARDMESQYGMSESSVEAYQDVLGEPGLAEYRRLAETAFRKCTARSRQAEDDTVDLDRLVRIMDFFAERDGDVEARIALRRRDLSSPYRYLSLAQFCLEHQRQREALSYAEEGLWTFEDERQDERLVIFTVDLLQKAGRTKDAEAHLWRAFEKAPNFDLYSRLRKICGEEARRRCLEALEQRHARQKMSGWNSSSNLIVEIQLSEKAFDDAWASLRRFEISADLRGRLAKATEKTHPAEVVKVYETDVERLATFGGYAEAAELIARMSKLRDKVVQAAYLAALKERHGRKRNFMKLLG
jgi:tetratricopeptide (TPR) repeat protein